MKRTLVFLGVFLLAHLTGFATEQVPDRLIIGKDTIYLKSFPLEDIKVNGASLKPPFMYGKYSFPHTGCWRGYIATWQVIDNFLLLTKVEKLDSVNTQLNIVEYWETRKCY